MSVDGELNPGMAVAWQSLLKFACEARAKLKRNRNEQKRACLGGGEEEKKQRLSPLCEWDEDRGQCVPVSV